MRFPTRKHQNILSSLLKPQTLTSPLLSSAAVILRHFSIDSDPIPPPPELSQSSPPPLTSGSPITEIVSILKTTPINDWPNNTSLHILLPSLTPSCFLKITRQLSSLESLEFFNYLKTPRPSPQPLHPTSLSFTFQALLEHVQRDYARDAKRLFELFTSVKDENIPLSVNSATLLLRALGRAKLVEESLTVFNYLDKDLWNTHVINLLAESLLRSGRFDDALQLLDGLFEPEAEFSPNDYTLDIVLTNVLGRQWTGRSVTEDEISKYVVRCAERGVFPNTWWVSQLMTKFCKRGRCDKAWELMHDLIKFGVKIEAPACNALLTGLSRERDVEKMNFFMKEMKEKGIEPDVVTLGIMANQLCKSYRVDDALEVLEMMKGGKKGERVAIEPDVVIYNTLIDGLFKVGRHEEGLELMERMRLRPICAPNTVTYNCVIDGLSKIGELDRARQIFDRMIEEGVKPNVITLNSLLDGMCRNGRVSSGMAFFNEMQGKGLKGNVISYTILISAFCNVANVGKAMKLFDEMLENGCSPDAIVYYSLIAGLSQSGRMDDAYFIMSKMRQAGYHLDVIGYNVMIGGFCRRNKLDKAYEMLKDMEEAGLKPDRVTYNTLISFFSEKGDFATAHRVMKNMVEEGFKPNVVTYGALIHAYCLAGNLDDAMAIFKDMASSTKVPPNTVIYNTLINSLCKSGKVEDALGLMDHMKEKGVKPNTTTFNAMLKGLQEKHWLDQALKLMDEMIELSCSPDYITMEIISEWFSAIGETDKLRKFIQGYEVHNSAAQVA